MLKTFKIAAATVLAVGVAGSAQAAIITPAVKYTSASTLIDNRPLTLGYTFSLSAPVTVDALGYWEDTLALGPPLNHQVGIWNCPTPLWLPRLS